MGLISEKLLGRRPQELGKIKIGGLGPVRKSSGGKEFQLPQRYDHFVATTRHRGRDGNFVRDPAIHEVVGPRPTELEGVLMFETPRENFHAEMVQYLGRTQVISCDGEEATRLEDGNCFGCPRAQGGECPKLGKPPKCKPYGRLHVQLRASPNTLGFHVFRTTSWESVRNIQSALQEIYQRFGTLFHAPIRLVLYPSEDTYQDGAKRKTGTSHKVGLVLAMGIEEAAARMVAADRTLKSARAQLRLVAGEVQEELRARDDAERQELADEFFPQQVAATKASIETAERFEAMKQELGVGAPTIDADFEVAREGDEDVLEPQLEPSSTGEPNDGPTEAELEVLGDLLAEARGLSAIGLDGEQSVADAKEQSDGPAIRRWIEALEARIEKAKSELSNGGD